MTRETRLRWSLAHFHLGGQFSRWMLTPKTPAADDTRTSVAVLATPFVRGGVATIECERLELGDALTRAWPTDAHLQLATSPRRPRSRLTVADVGRAPIALECVAFDIDTPGHAPITPEWCDELRAKLPAAPPAPLLSFTRNGARLWWRLASPLPIASEADARTWRARYLAQCDELERAAGIVCDRSCSDWQRLHRAPHAKRDPGGAPERLDVVGDAHNIGAIELPAVSAPEHRTPTPPPRREQSERYGGGVTCDATSVSTPLLRGLERAGLIVGPGPTAGSLRIVCPYDLAHTTGTPGDGSTLYYAPSSFGGGGWIHCKHRCGKIRTARDWRRRIARYTGHRDSLRSSLAGNGGV